MFHVSKFGVRSVEVRVSRAASRAILCVFNGYYDGDNDLHQPSVTHRLYSLTLLSLNKTALCLSNIAAFLLCSSFSLLQSC